MVTSASPTPPAFSTWSPAASSHATLTSVAFNAPTIYSAIQPPIAPRVVPTWRVVAASNCSLVGQTGALLLGGRPGAMSCASGCWNFVRPVKKTINALASDWEFLLERIGRGVRHGDVSMLTFSSTQDESRGLFPIGGGTHVAAPFFLSNLSRR